MDAVLIGRVVDACRMHHRSRLRGQIPRAILLAAAVPSRQPVRRDLPGTRAWRSKGDAAALQAMIDETLDPMPQGFDHCRAVGGGAKGLGRMLRWDG